MRTIIKQLIPPMLLDFLRKPKYCGRRYFALNQLDGKLEKYLNYNDGYFVELGANDGITQSNTFYFESFRGWHGILVEPSPNKYLQCIANRSKRSHVFCNACVSFGYDERFVEIIYSNLMSTPVGLESDVIEPAIHARSGSIFLGEEVSFTYGAVASTLNDLLVKANAPKQMDLLSLDVEGAEIEVLKGINHAEFSFKYACLESRNIDRVSAYMQEVGYELIEVLSSHDYLFRKKAV